MCWMLYVGVSSYRGDAVQPFRKYGFGTALASNPTCAFLPGALRLEVTAGWCSCGIYAGARKAKPGNLDHQRRKYEKKGWSAAKIERALASATRTHTTPQINPRDHAAQFADAIKTLVEGNGKVTLLAHFFDGAFTEPFEISGSTRTSLEDYVTGGNSFPHDSLVSIQPST